MGGDIIRTTPTRADQMDESSMGTLRAVAISELSQPATATAPTNGRQARSGLLCHYGLAEIAIRFCLLRSSLMCVRASRHRRNASVISTDIAEAATL